MKDPKNIDRVRAEIDAALEKAKSTPVSPERLRDIKSHLKYQYAMGLDNPDAVASSISHYIQLTGDPESVNRVYQLYDQVTPQDIMDVTKSYLTPNNRTVVILTQEESSQ